MIIWSTVIITQDQRGKRGLDEFAWAILLVMSFSFFAASYALIRRFLAFGTIELGPDAVKFVSGRMEVNVPWEAFATYVESSSIINRRMDVSLNANGASRIEALVNGVPVDWVQMKKGPFRARLVMRGVVSNHFDISASMYDEYAYRIDEIHWLIVNIANQVIAKEGNKEIDVYRQFL